MDTIVVNGFFVGLVYAILGIGFVVVYRTSRVINFSYGESGALVAFVFAELRLGQGFTGGADHGILLTLPVALALAAAIGAATEFVVIRQLRDAPRVRPLLGTFAVGSLLFVASWRRWGTDVHFIKPLVEGEGVRIAGLTVQPQQLLILAATAAVLVGLWALYRFTSFGLELRAIAVDPYAASLVGVNVNRTSMVSWAIAGLLTGLSAILVAPVVAFDVFFMNALVVRGLAAGLVGGLTSFWGACVAGIAIGVVEAVIAFESPVRGLTDALVALFVLVLMVVRPQGLVRSAY